MKITTILVFVFVFALVAVGGATLFNDTASNYNIALQSGVSDSYDNIQEYYSNIESVEGQIKGTDSAAETNVDNNFITSVKSMWSSVQLFFNSYAFVTDLSTNIGEDLGIPATVITVISGLILLSFIALIFSIAVRWTSD